MKRNYFLTIINTILTYFLAIITSIFIIFVFEDIPTDGGQIATAFVIFLIYVILGVPVTLVIDSIVKIIPKQRLLYTYLIQVLLFFFVIVLLSLIEGSLIFYKIKALLPKGKASFTIVDLISKKH